MPRQWLVPLALVVASIPAAAAPINLGLFSFDVLIPGSAGVPGTNVLNIFNLTGPSFFLPPDFPVLSEVSILNAIVSLEANSNPIAVSLGDLPPGPYSPTARLEFPETSFIGNVLLTGRLSSSTWTLASGDRFVADSTDVSVRIQNSTFTGFLGAGFDFSIISVSGRIIPPRVTPEPTSITLVGTGLVIAILRLRKDVRR